MTFNYINFTNSLRDEYELLLWLLFGGYLSVGGNVA